MADMDLQIKIEALTKQAQDAFAGITSAIDAIKDSTSAASKELNAFDKASQSLTSVGDRLNSIGDGVKKFGQNLSLYVTAPLVAIGALAVKEFSNAQNETNKLNTALANSGRYSEEASRGMRDYADELEKVSTFSAGAITDSLALATSFSRSNEQAKQLVSAASDLATFMGTDLNSAVRTLGMTMNGQAGRLGQLVEGLDQLSEAELKAGAAVDIVAAKFRGQAAAAASTLGGQLTILRHQFEQLLEVIGADLAPFVQSIAGFFRELITSFTNLDASTRKIILLFAAFAAALGPAIVILGTLISSLGTIATAMGTVLAPIAAFASAWGGIVIAIIAVGTSIAGLINLFSKLKDAGLTNFQALISVFGLVGSAWQQYVAAPILEGVGLIIYSLGKLPLIGKTAFGEFVQNAATEIGALADRLGVKFDESKAAINTKLAEIGTSAGEAFTFGLSTELEEIAENVKSFFNTVGGSISQPIVENVDTAEQEVGWLTEFLKSKSLEIKTTFSANLASSFLDFVEGTKSAKQAFADFARQTLRYISQMIIQQAIFNSLSGLFGGGARPPSGGGASLGNNVGSNFLNAATGGFINNNKLQRFDSGGSVVGPGSGTSDSILARLSNGEFVVRAAAVKAVGTNFLSAINSMGGRSRVAAFADGGMVQGGGQGTIVIENKGSEKQATGSQFDPQTGVTTIVLEDLNRNGPISKAIQSNYSMKRGGFR